MRRGLIVALLVYFACRGMVKDIGSEPDRRPLSLRNLLYVLAGTVVMIFVCAWLMHNVKIANLVLIILSVVVTIFSSARPSSWIRPGATKCSSPLS